MIKSLSSANRLPDQPDIIDKLVQHADPAEYSAEELEIVIDVLENRYDHLDAFWTEYFETLVAARLSCTKT
jgi:hypothetical protein